MIEMNKVWLDEFCLSTIEKCDGAATRVFLADFLAMSFQVEEQEAFRLVTKSLTRLVRKGSLASKEHAIKETNEQTRLYFIKEDTDDDAELTR